MTPEEHGRALKAAMLLRNVSTETVGDTCGVSARTVHNWLTGRTLPNLRHYARLRDIFGDYDGALG